MASFLHCPPYPSHALSLRCCSCRHYCQTAAKGYQMINEFLVLSPRGDTLILKNYAGSANRSTADNFLRHVKKLKSEGKRSVPPVFVLDGVTYCHLQLSAMYFLFTTLRNVQAATLVELLQRLARVFKDYCGVITEESVRRNFLLLYELLDEVFDHGVPQGMSTELLKAYVYNEPIAVSTVPGSSLSSSIVNNMGLGKLVSGIDKMANSLPGVDKVANALDKVPGLGEKKTLASSAANKPITVSGEKKDSEVFVDVIEKLTVVINRNGQVAHSYINGSIVLRSFMTGSPEMRLGLNDELAIHSLGIRTPPRYNTQQQPVLPMDDCVMHECVRWEEAGRSAVFSFFAPDGEFTLLAYRISASFRPPIMVQPFLEPQGTKGLDYVLRVRAEFPTDRTASTVVISFALPHFASSVSLETAVAAPGGSSAATAPPTTAGKAEQDRKTQMVTWHIPRLPGGGEVIIRSKIMLVPGFEPASADLSDFGLVRVSFELPMYLVSGVQIKFLDIIHGAGRSPPAKWIRNVTQALSYVARWT